MTEIKYDAVQGVVYVLDGEWNEDDHPRDGQGRFAAVEGGQYGGVSKHSPEIQASHDALKTAHAALKKAPALEIKGRYYERVLNKVIEKGPNGRDMYGHSIEVRLHDPKIGSGVTRTVTGPIDATHATKMLGEMHKELKAAAKEYKARKASWAGVNRS